MSVFDQINKISVSCRPRVKVPQKTTCRNASVVDYCITSPELLKLFFDFDILESSKLFSDVHAPLHILLSVNLNNNDSNSNTVRKTNHSKAKIVQD
jgi:hypothetical protein